MELQYSRVNNTMAKRLWRILRVTLLMIRKGVISKRKLIMDINLMMKRGKLLRKNVTNLIFHHRHMAAAAAAGRSGGYGVQEYEFSCSNSPNPVFFRTLKRKHAALSYYFPCMNRPPRVIEEEVDDEWRSLKYKDQSALMVVAPNKTTAPASPFAVRVSSFSSEDDQDDEYDGVDDEAEEFIRRFYEQLRTQGRTQLLQYQDQD